MSATSPSTPTSTHTGPELRPRPDWAKPGQNRIPLLVTSVSLCCVVAGVFVGLRFQLRRKGKIIGLDDWLALAALVMLWSQGAIGIWGAAIGVTNHVWDIDPSLFPLMGRLTLTVQTQYQVGCAFVQLSIIMLVRRLAYVIPHYRFITLALSGICIALAITRIVTNFMFVDIWYFSATISLLLDMVIWCLPLPMIWSMRGSSFTRRKKLQVMATFAVGLIACAVSLTRLATRLMDTKGPEPEKRNWNRVFLLIFDQIEISLGIVCASMPALQSLVASVAKSLGDKMIELGLCSSRRERRQRMVPIRKRIGAEHDLQPGDSGWGSSIARERERKRFEAELGEIVIGKGPDGQIELDVEGLGVLDRMPPLPLLRQSTLGHTQHRSTAETIKQPAAATLPSSSTQIISPRLNYTPPSPVLQPSLSAASSITLPTAAAREPTPPPPASSSVGSSHHRVGFRLSQMLNFRSPTQPPMAYYSPYDDRLYASEERLSQTNPVIPPPADEPRRNHRQQIPAEQHATGISNDTTL